MDFFCFLMVSEAKRRDSWRTSIALIALSLEAMLWSAFSSMGSPWQSQPGLYSTRYLGVKKQIDVAYPESSL